MIPSRPSKPAKKRAADAAEFGEETSLLSYEVEPRGEKHLVTLHGRVGELEANQLQLELLTLVDQGARRIVLDLTDVPFITSSCLGAMMVAHKHLRKENGALRVAGAQPLVRQILEITKLFKLFGRYDSIQAALDAD
jgi:anti-sigma B factor antagonist